MRKYHPAFYNKGNNYSMKDIKKYIHVGDYFYYCYDGEILPISRTTVCDLFGPDGIREIINRRHYIDFIYDPCESDFQNNYNYFNLYQPMFWKQIDGGYWPNIDRVLRHIFIDFDYQVDIRNLGCSFAVNNRYKMALDYISLLLQQPKQKLPVLCLLSNENRTGLTSFLDLLQAIFRENMSIVDTSLIRSPNPAAKNIYHKLIIGVDDVDIHDNDPFMEKIKFLNTTKSFDIQLKGREPFQLDNFMKIIICSNEGKEYLYRDSEDIKFWVVNVDRLPESERIPNILEKFYEEIPAFLHYLYNRPKDKWLVPEAECSLWFAPERFKRGMDSKLSNLKNRYKELEKEVEAL